ncbi:MULTISPECIES: hypothetical protein [unclassified Streptomyces]|uniref:hypothetical protein n=1 Tax=unclassified Streptomyces TaxID=2593676 RepID=UPI0032D56C14
MRTQRPTVPISRTRTFIVTCVMSLGLSALTSSLIMLATVVILGMDASHLPLLWVFSFCATAAVGLGVQALLAVFGGIGQLISKFVFEVGAVAALLFGFAMTGYYDRKGLHRIVPEHASHPASGRKPRTSRPRAGGARQEVRAGDRSHCLGRCLLRRQAEAAPLAGLPHHPPLLEIGVNSCAGEGGQRCTGGAETMVADGLKLARCLTSTRTGPLIPSERFMTTPTTVAATTGTGGSATGPIAQAG